VSPRASYDGADLLRAGFTWKETEEMVIWKGLDSEIRRKVLSAV
jgi:hypothetical protein